jgi:hypothetical protein
VSAEDEVSLNSTVYRREATRSLLLGEVFADTVDLYHGDNMGGEQVFFVT